ncbi:methylenetetrahydrofolate reductase [Herbidospora yilanensis]|uniref:methylenetetrahydrofolate reductase n=1 Tax=Herbidospora yilanensis TaxID=354426 RepID=UPI000785245F|nr:methylenetetrahydrofolate reductase [Herbidospora yilanensis]
MSGLRAALADGGRFVVTAEVGPPRDADPDAITRRAKALRGWVDAANVTDNQGANARMSSLAASVLLRAAGVEPVMQLTCRDRNRIALQSDLIGAAALGVPNVLLLTGDHPSLGDHPEAKPVFDLDGVQLVWTARRMRDEGVLLSGRPLGRRPSWLIGTVENPFAPPTAARARRLAKKAAAGAEFAQTQYVFDLPAFARWTAMLRDEGVTERCAVLAGVGPIRSLRMLAFLSTGVPGVHVPDEVARRLRGVPERRVEEEGLAICEETLRELAATPGVRGAHLMVFGHEDEVPDLLRRAEIRKGDPDVDRL